MSGFAAIRSPSKRHRITGFRAIPRKPVHASRVHTSYADESPVPDVTRRGNQRMSATPTIIYTLTDEAPALATAAFLPIVRAFAAPAGINVTTSDISVAARILGEFPEFLTEPQRVPDNLAELGRLTLLPETNIIKLPNISASVAQLKAAIKELQGKGYKVPDYPENPKTDDEKAIRARYAKCIGSAVNPVLREGNSDRRAPLAVKNYARKNPHSMAEWSQASRSHVSHMHGGDFYHGEKSMTLDRARDVKMELITKSGKTILLKPKVSLQDREIIDSMFMSKKALLEFYEKEIEDAYKTGVMFSLHVKATMMKVSHPIVFGHCVKIFYRDAFEKHDELFRELGVNVNNGMVDLYNKIATLPQSKQDEIKRDLHACHEHRPELAMVDSAKGITNFHSPNDIIVDASMPAMIRNGGKMWGADGRLKDVKAVMPESTFARIYQEMINFCKWHGNFDPKTMGTVPNVGLMAQQAEEYGSHDKTFEIPEDGVANITDLATGEVLLSEDVEQGDIWRMCQTKDAAVRDWVKLAVTRARNSGMPVLFWLDPYRPHEAQLITKVKMYLHEHDTSGLDIQIMSQVRAMRYTLERVIRGQDTISATGNILRDYLTDLFPIMELGTSAKMLSIVPLMAGGGMYETGAGGSAPKHVQQLVEENHLRWDSLGEFLALAVSLEDLGLKTNNPKAKLLAKTLDAATGKLLDNNKSPSPRTGELDNRGSQFYLAMYWAQELAAQTEDPELQAKFKGLAEVLAQNEEKIVAELAAVQGQPADIGGYYLPDAAKCASVMRPSKTLNAALAQVSE
ncbi:isocitrate dehydrogenase (NADP) [Bradyrhizobiaceae bacterium SG-6C]|nr:isocitrate dehydrogenase (NADP) [Bradyrhizobiaceae bacterium SG-6C]